MKKVKTFYSRYFIGKSHFQEYGTQNYLVFQPMYIYFKQIPGFGNGSYIYHCKSKGLPDEKIILLKRIIIVILRSNLDFRSNLDN